ncbi:hypothetical protein AVEN_227200-1 [Araneus ventricosus]|uniref:Uncharacterized protein n=1 Tax=Araneus ventricosus TaxID=182803 RepID=A0A4Y2M376_ARAVE|nr:hypothetical protein AVEN_227200-1 [Araneus ventricosus]
MASAHTHNARLMNIKLVKLHTKRFMGCSGLVIRSRPRDRRVTGSKPDSPEDLPCMGPVARQIIHSGQTSSRWFGAEVWRRGASSGVVFVI